MLPSTWFQCFELDASNDVILRTAPGAIGGGTTEVGMDLSSALSRVVTDANKIRVISTV